MGSLHPWASAIRGPRTDSLTLECLMVLSDCGSEISQLLKFLRVFIIATLTFTPLGRL